MSRTICENSLPVLSSKDLEERAGKRARTTVGGDGGDEVKEGVANADGDDAYESPEAWAGAHNHSPLYFSRLVFPNKGISHFKITRMHARGISLGVFCRAPSKALRGLIDGIFFSAWEEEMKQYAGWEKGEGARAGPMTVHQPCVDASGSF